MTHFDRLPQCYWTAERAPLAAEADPDAAFDDMLKEALRQLWTNGGVAAYLSFHGLFTPEEIARHGEAAKQEAQRRYRAAQGAGA